jgi:hypothetical protein
MLVNVEVLVESLRLDRVSGPYYYAGDRFTADSESEAFKEAMESGELRVVEKPFAAPAVAVATMDSPPADKMLRKTSAVKK